jgi:hypothetical protein
MKVYLDDIREAPEGWLRVISVEATTELLRFNKIEKLSLDHDLAMSHYCGDYSKEKTGYDVLLWIEAEVVANEKFQLPEIKLHTANPSAKIKMKLALDKILKLKQELSAPPAESERYEK